MGGAWGECASFEPSFRVQGGGRIRDVVPALRSTDWKCPMVVWEVESEGCDGSARETKGLEIV